MTVLFSRAPVITSSPPKGKFAEKNLIRKPIISDEPVSDEQAEQIVRDISNAAVAGVQEAMKRGFSNLHDVEGLLWTLIAMGLKTEDPAVVARLNTIGGLLKTMIGVIKARESLELDQEAAERLKLIEDEITRLSGK